MELSEIPDRKLTLAAHTPNMKGGCEGGMWRGGVEGGAGAGGVRTGCGDRAAWA